mmetsp:Transcript_981/g.2071  ORF Transcript_981/g.2071 Transcript_981/m.2071 type:complete len:137 (-) Transcript_981:336-746(-)
MSGLSSLPTWIGRPMRQIPATFVTQEVYVGYLDGPRRKEKSLCIPTINNRSVDSARVCPSQGWSKMPSPLFSLSSTRGKEVDLGERTSYTTPYVVDSSYFNQTNNYRNNNNNNNNVPHNMSRARDGAVQGLGRKRA